MDEDGSRSSGFESLFIEEEDAAPGSTRSERSGLPAYRGARRDQSPPIKPYLREMDDLLKSCEELVGVPFASRFPAAHGSTSSAESPRSHGEGRGAPPDGCGETSACPRAYLSTSYMDTHADGPEAPDGSHVSLDVGNRCGVTPAASRQKEMPLTSAGNQLSDTMVAYEGQLLGMLAMLESSMEESGMDFEPQGCSPDAGQEYVHIGKNARPPRPVERESPMALETTQPMQSEPWCGRRFGGDEGCRETAGSAAGGGRRSRLPACEDMDGFSMKSLEWRDRRVLDPQFGFPAPLVSTGNDPMSCEAAMTGYMATNEGTHTEGEVGGVEVDKELRMDTVAPGPGVNDLGALGCQMEECIEQVQRLERRRKELLTEVLELRGTKDGESDGGDEPVDSKVVELLRREEEKLQSLALQLTEEGSRQRAAQQQQVSALQAALHAGTSSPTSSTQEELAECRRQSCADLQQYLQGGLKALEDRYEPILLTLLKRREATAVALLKAKEQGRELKAQLGPLKEETQKLNLQRACLEEKLKLLHFQRREEVGQYKEAVSCLEDSSRELRTELKIQKRKTREVEELRDSLDKRLHLYRAAIEEHNESDNEEES
uniref:Syncoilin, intermediate filament protein n=1 Tax=Gasterosteus aculeatus aculeatus TaxID=481459 RepID=A0AAQ4R642_GASAC